LAARRQEVIAANIANINTPGYKRREISFGDVLSREMRSSGAGARSRVPYRATVDRSGTMRADGNNVDMEREMGDQAKNAILYSALAQQASSYLSMAHRVITGGRG
jgi:flagellar basal-body rod protein FlgB